jgi:Lecithin retinol acyltransferase
MGDMATVSDERKGAAWRWPSGLHYSGLSGFWQCGPVEEIPLSRFAVGHLVQIVDHDRSAYSPEEIVRRARSRIGEDDYRLLTNNCEHFCN